MNFHQRKSPLMPFLASSDVSQAQILVLSTWIDAGQVARTAKQSSD
jgi:hypothetical protein